MIRRRERGASAVEFAIVLPVLLLMIGGLIDFGRLYFENVVLANAARDGVRTAIVANKSSRIADVTSRVQSAANPFSVTVSSLTKGGVALADGTDCVPSGAEVAVVVTPTDPFAWTLLSAFAIPTPTVAGRATMSCP